MKVIKLEWDFSALPLILLILIAVPLLLLWFKSISYLLFGSSESRARKHEIKKLEAEIEVIQKSLYR